MAKREHGQANGGRPAKRQRRQSGMSTDGDVAMGSADEGGDGEYGEEGAGTVQGQGLELWQVARDAVNKEGRQLATQFLHKPPRKIYPDYYSLITSPIAFDDIRKKLDRNAYTALDDVRADFELCFTNAKTYNLKGSDIYSDAKDLLKLVNKTAARLSGTQVKKDKVPNLHKLLKSRLQKLIDKTDDNGRILSTEFMELPSKKLWPIYYKTIKNPECLEAIRKRVKDKTYTNAADFAAGVELVFNNAMSFNQEYTMIWEDAKALKEHFHQLMSDMPPPFDLPQYSQGSGATKIKLKLGKAAAPAPQEAPAASTSSHITLRVPAAPAAATHEPPVKPSPPEPSLPVATVTATKAAAATPKPAQAKAQPRTAAPSAASPALATPTVPATRPSVHTFSAVPGPSTASPATPSIVTPGATFAQKPTKVARAVAPRTTPKVQQPKPQQARIPTVPQPRSMTSTPQQPAYVQTQPNATYFSGYNQPAPAPAAPPAPAPAPLPIAPNASTASAKSPDPPPLDPSRQLRSILMRTQPRGRCIALDHREGVKSWAIRLGANERALQISNLRFIGKEVESDESSEEEPGEEEEDEEILKRRPRGRPSKAAAAALKAAQERVDRRARKRAKNAREIFVKMNGTAVAEKVKTTQLNGGGQDGNDHRSQFEDKEWTVDLQFGHTMIDIGEKDGMVWKVYVDRPALA
ncbi:hypothetical protein BD626DRAFT_196124 [Schizophyllum amplum]|uniref:Bromo domain-containing protein n=1 Tax=Schizophyllum amplum TaxID=97359 RepID=A0A550CMM9_9AGAR|nr:hypothetical protein BD626DRAFT_196124 [Auriculariopsis ampla]